MKIAINGIGIAGPALAWWLKFYGHQPVLFEKSPELRTGGYIIDFWGVGYDVAEKMGLIPALQSKSYKIDSLKLVNSYGKKVAAMNTKFLREATKNRFFSLTRSDVSQVLFKACEKEKIEANFGLSIVGVEEIDNAVLATLSDGSNEKFDLVVGADGLHSKIRQVVFGPSENFLYHMDAVVSAYTLQDYQPRDELTYVAHATPMKQVSRVSLRDKKTLFLFTFRSELIQTWPKNHQEQKQILRSIFSDMNWEVPQILSRLDEVDDLYFDSVSQIRMKTWHQGRVILLGDAACCISLLGGEGTGLAITEGFLLAKQINADHGNFALAFKNYEKKLRSFILQKQNQAQKLLIFFAPTNSWQIFIRNLVMKITNIKFLFNILVAKTLRDDIDIS